MLTDPIRTACAARLPREIAAAVDCDVPGAEGDCDLLKLRPDFVLYARHGFDREK